MTNQDELKNFAFFSGISDDRLSEIAGICDVHDIMADRAVFSQDDAATHIHGVLEGEVELVLLFKDKKLKAEIQYEESLVVRHEIFETPIVIDTLHPGDVFGWSSLIPSFTYTATAICSKKSRTFSIPADSLKQIMDKDHALGYLLMGRLNEIIGRRMIKRTESLIESWGEAFGAEKI